MYLTDLWMEWQRSCGGSDFQVWSLCSARVICVEVSRSYGIIIYYIN